MQGKGVSTETINSMLSLLELKSWAIVALLEVDFVTYKFPGDGEFQVLPESGHLFARHHSGPGTRAYGLLVHSSLRARVKQLSCGWRSYRLDLRSDDSADLSGQPARSYLFSHLAHDDFSESLAVALSLGRTRPRGSTLTWLGDINADILNKNGRFDQYQEACRNMGLTWCPLRFWEPTMNLSLIHI